MMTVMLEYGQVTLSSTAQRGRVLEAQARYYQCLQNGRD